jgi:RNA polymerase sigma factor (sigma-70 family)
MPDEDRQLADTIAREGGRLRNFIRARVAREDVEDVLQDVLFELVEARNRIIDRFRKKKPESSDLASLEDMLPSPDAGPEAAYARGVLLEEIEAALEELPEEQRFAFVAHELEGRSFRELAAETGVGVNTLLSRKRYAVLHLRRRLQKIYDEFKEKRT